MEQILQLVISGCTLLGMIWFVFNQVRNPDDRADKEIAILKEKLSMSCEQLKLMKENHLPHIESEMRKLSENQVKIFTILEERLPTKNNN